jgi:thioredoxin reductase
MTTTVERQRPGPVSDLPLERADVLIVGAGPAGLAAAARLRELGAGKVVLIERQPDAGGIPRHCGHSPFGMREFHRVLSGKRYAARLIDAAVSAGADLRLRNSVVCLQPGSRALVATPEGSRIIEASQILLATGVREMTRASRLVSGSRPQGIFNTAALQDMVFLRRMRPFARPVIVGTELVAMSAILTCLSAGARPAAIIERGGRPLARAPFSWLPEALRIPRFFDTEIAEIFGGASVEAVTLRSRIDGTTTRISCDGVLFTGCFTPEASLPRSAGMAIDAGTMGPAVDLNGRTSLRGVYAAGNVLRGVETAGHCWSEGRAVAQAMASDLDRPTEQPEVVIESGPGIKYIMPQRLSSGGQSAFKSVQLRLTDWIDGELALEQDGRTVWSRRLVSGPERRISVPVETLTRLQGTVRMVARTAGDKP